MCSLAKLAINTGYAGKAARLYFHRRFSANATVRVLIYYTKGRISFSQIYPLLFYEKEIFRMWRAQVRLAPIEEFLDRNNEKRSDADVYIVQPWFTVDPYILRDSLEQLISKKPLSTICFLDAFAHNDLRLAKHVHPYIHFYAKKSLFRDRSNYFIPFCGDTNLTDYYGALYGIHASPVDWEVPTSILPKLRLWPNFFTAPEFLKGFSKSKLSTSFERNIDLHSRLGSKGTPWYQMMREESLIAARAIPKVKLFEGSGVSWRQYMNELANSKLCYSPFGYGELCWRDIEAFVSGAVLVKPDMSHLNTLPNLYKGNETYLPIKWDFSDVSEVVQSILKDEERRRAIATNAFERVRDYIVAGNLLMDLGFLFTKSD